MHVVKSSARCYCVAVGAGRTTLIKPWTALRRSTSSFNAALEFRDAISPPAHWYTDARHAADEVGTIFSRNWVAVGATHELGKAAGSYFTGSVINQPFVVVRRDDGSVNTFHNVCRHRGARVVDGAGELPACRLVCPYHGWQYTLDGRLAQATRMKGVRGFDAREHGLAPLPVLVAGPLVYLWFGRSLPTAADRAPVDAVHAALQSTGYGELAFVKRIRYDVRCNWKVRVALDAV